MSRGWWTVLAGCLLAGCSAATDPPATSRLPVPSPSITGTGGCFDVRVAQSFLILDRSNLIVYAPNDSNAYHVRIGPPSWELRVAESLAFLSPNGRICGYAGERLLVGRGVGTQRFSVLDVSRLAPDSLAALRAGTEGEAIPAARPQPGPGAAIEGTTRPAATEKPGE